LPGSEVEPDTEAEALPREPDPEAGGADTGSRLPEPEIARQHSRVGQQRC